VSDLQELWVLTYLHDWDPDGKVYPEVSAIYNSWHEAEKARLAKISPEKYWIRRGRVQEPAA